MGASDSRGLLIDGPGGPSTGPSAGEASAFFEFFQANVSLSGALGGQEEADELVELVKDILYHVPISLENLSFDDGYGDLDVDAIKPTFSEVDIEDLAYTLAVLAAFDKVTDFIMKKPTIPSMVIGAVIKYGSKALMLEYIRNEYGTAARNYASELLDTGKDIYALSQKEGGYNCADVQGVSKTLAKHVGDFVLSASVAKFDGFTKRFKFNRNKKDKKKKKYGSKKFFKELNKQSTGKKSSMYGLLGEKEATRGLKKKGWEVLKGEKTTKPNWKKFKAEHASYTGQNGIDGIFKKTHADGTIEYIIMDAKTKVNGIQPERCNAGSKAGLCNTQNGTQLSNEWILGHIDSSGLSATDRINIRKAIERSKDNPNIKITRYVAKVSKKKVVYYNVVPVGERSVKIPNTTTGEITYYHKLKKW